MNQALTASGAGATALLPNPTEPPQDRLPFRLGMQVFLAFALAYFFSALVRAVTATLAPTLTQEFSLTARSLGLLAGAYFLGFAATQLTLGKWLDRYGPRRVILGFLSVAVLGCVAFALAGNFAMLLAARALCGVGVSACLMAPLTGYRRWYSSEVQLRTNSWMLMSGSTGMVASTLPVQWLMPTLGWRGLFVMMAVLIALAMALLAWKVPAWRKDAGTNAGAGASASAGTDSNAAPEDAGYRIVWQHPYFRSLVPLGFFSYGGFVAIQTLWAGPWMVKVTGSTALGAATGLFWLNLCMLSTFWTWGLVNPWLVRRGLHAQRLIALGMPVSLVVLVACVAGGSSTHWWGWALFCVSSTVISLAQPAIGLAFAPSVAGRALSAFNLVVFSGVFVVQWGIGLLIDAAAALGLGTVASFQAAFAVYAVASVLAYAWFMATKPHN